MPDEKQLTPEEQADLEKRLAEINIDSLTSVIANPPPIKTQLPDAIPVTTIDGRSIQELDAHIKQQQIDQAYLTPQQKQKALEAEQANLQTEEENRELAAGQVPLRFVARYKKQIATAAAVTAGATVISKLIGCF